MKRKRPELSRKTLVLQYTITFAICAVLAFIWASASGIFHSYEQVVADTHWNIANEAQKNYFLLTNAFFGVGAITAGIGLLVVASNGGAFEMLYYGLRRFISLFQRDPNKFRFRTFYDYQVYRQGKESSSFVFLLVIGGLFLAVSFIFLSLYNGAAPAA